MAKSSVIRISAELKEKLESILESSDRFESISDLIDEMANQFGIQWSRELLVRGVIEQIIGATTVAILIGRRDTFPSKGFHFHYCEEKLSIDLSAGISDYEMLSVGEKYLEEEDLRILKEYLDKKEEEPKELFLLGATVENKWYHAR